MAGPQCCSNPPILNSGSGIGRVVEVGGLKTYVTGSSASAILLVSDVFGYEAPKLRKLADKIAKAGFYVVVPDFFHGDPFCYENVDKPLPIWLKLHGGEKGFEDAKHVVKDLRKQGITSVGAAGFCWGAKVVVQLSKPDYIQAAVMLHPSFVTQDDIKEVRVPMAILGAEVDKYCPAHVLQQFEHIISSNTQLISHVKTFPGTTHGWTTRYEDGDEVAIAAAEEAHSDIIDWFTKHVKYSLS